ncbi:MAG: hypothetical protein ACLQDQ_13270 [Myxococcaceae bacterium]
MRVDVEKVSDRLGLFLGAAIFLFGSLKLFDPFHSWFELQVANSGLPPPSFVMGIAGEIGTGVALLGSFIARRQLADARHALSAGACLSLIVMMCVATYVHLQPNVPAAVLPLGIKPPVIPLSFLMLAAGDLLMHARLWLEGARASTFMESRDEGREWCRRPQCLESVRALAPHSRVALRAGDSTWL